jgi:RHS repeat-associated protein
VVQVSDNVGTLVSEIDYDPWGRIVGTSGTYTPYLRFLSKGWDMQAQMHNLEHRMYDPTTRMFISPDTRALSPFNTSTLNRYSYAAEGPLNYSDPTGQFSLEGFLRAVAPSGITQTTYYYTPGSGWTQSSIEFTSFSAPGVPIPIVMSSNMMAVDSTIMAHIGLDMAGAVPVVGAGFDLLHAEMYRREGDTFNAILSVAMASVEGAGQVGATARIYKNLKRAAAARQGLKAVKLSPKALKAIEEGYLISQEHHIFPEEFIKAFEAKGITIDMFVVKMNRTDHLRNAHGNGVLGYNVHWNNVWSELIIENQDTIWRSMDYDQIMEFGLEMMKDYGIDGPLTIYRSGGVPSPLMR